MFKALEHARDVMSAPPNGGRPYNPNVKQEIFIITDGCANCHHDQQNGFENLMQSISRKNIDIYVIGLRLTSHCQENLMHLAAGGNCYHFFFIPNLEEDVFIRELEKNRCLQQLESTNRDCSGSIN
ncbi:uncharacterized protein LOC144742581 [Ciona intestinalis]